MPLARWKDLCLDAVDASRLGRFYAGLLDRDLEVIDDDQVVLRGARPADTIWVNRVPEPKRVKHRVHLDLHAPSLDRALDLGATVLLPAAESGNGWSVLADPEGGEFCIFERAHLDADAPASYYELSIDTADLRTARAAAAWWGSVLGGEVHADAERGFAWLAGADGPFESFVFAPVPEAKLGKNRVHVDVVTDDLDALRRHGAATLLPAADGRTWEVLADPQGDEFCAFPVDG